MTWPETGFEPVSRVNWRWAWVWTDCSGATDADADRFADMYGGSVVVAVEDSSGPKANLQVMCSVLGFRSDVHERSGPRSSGRVHRCQLRVRLIG
ncbi:hypothetical protein SBA4_3430011 [Candidatus Sulfopaludibacter sp. SbA4]|nr:hypothetical protein SBA4_3430011 [Candidatus Sulfopaludibacter sp. SbA4]